MAPRSTHPSSYRRLRDRGSLALLAAGVLVGTGVPRVALATPASVITPPVPNVLLLLDSSGSMENWTDGNAVACNATGGADSGNVCSAAPQTMPTVRSAENKWGSIITALSGSAIQQDSSSPNWYWYEMNRAAGSDFDNEYRLNGQAVYDVGYSLPYHRMATWDASANGGAGAYCLLSPGQMPVGPAGTTLGVGTGAGPAYTHDQPDAYNFSSYFSQLTPSAIHMVNGKLNGAGAGTGPTNSCTFALNGDGNIDAVRDLVRFGVMTFDNAIGEGTGENASASGLQVIALNPSQDMWSYFPGWNNQAATWTAPTACATNPLVSPADQTTTCYGTPPAYYSIGSPSVACGLFTPYEVGARNPAAPPWEGRMVQFPDGRAPLSAQESTNDEVKNVITATRPYGATPIAGMMTDARNYFRFDPNGPEVSDPYVRSVAGGVHGCRDQYIILLTDGGANLDLQPTCSAGSPASPNTCPYEKPENVAKDLCSGGSGTPATGACSSTSGSYAAVTTFVIGFSFENFKGPDGTQTSCQQMVSNAGGSPGVCMANPCTLNATVSANAATPGPTQSCCNLINIACNGSAGQIAPFFADNAADLNGTFAKILSAVTRQASSHVVPVFATAYGTAGTSTIEQEYFTASYNTGNFETNNNASINTQPWTGSLVRHKIGCDGHTDTQDDYANLISGSTNRNYLVAVTNIASGNDNVSLRPFIGASSDGVTSLTTRENLGSGASVVVPGSTTDQLRDYQITSGFSCPADPVTGARLNAANCATYAGDFYAGLTPPTTGDIPGPTNLTSYNKAVNRQNFQLGPIINSVPAYVSAPSLALSDTSYRAFAQLYNTRPNTLYVETTDGALHAFNADYDASVTGSKPEFFTFLPPADISQLANNLPGADKTLLDGSPVVADTVWSRTSTTQADWHTTLVSSFGAGGRGYFALDVTQPQTSGWTAESTTYTADTSKNGPHFLWQLTSTTTASNPVELFGAVGATPAITTLYAQVGTASGAGEVGVAILPGGTDGNGPTGVCNRSTAASNGALPTGASTSGGIAAETPDYTSLASTPTQIAPRKMVRAWSALPSGVATPADCGRFGTVNGRSVSIVRLSDGFIIATFINPIDAVKLPPVNTAGGSKRLFTTFDSPMIGTPVTYPAGGGRLARSAYISDADGLIWKLDLSAPLPQNWTASLFFDPMNQLVTKTGATIATLCAPPGTNCTPDAAAASLSQPLTGPPILSIGPDSSLVLNFATGDQTLFTSAAFTAGSQDKISDELPNGIMNFVWSVSDTTTGTSPHWYVPFDGSSSFNDTVASGVPGNGGERVTGPMAVFDGVLYFATLKPQDTNAAACQQSEARIYGMDYFNLNLAAKPATGAGCPIGTTGQDIGCGGVRRLLPAVVTIPATASPQYEVPALQATLGGTSIAGSHIAGAEIPGVAVTEVQSCTTSVPGTSNYFGAGSGSYNVPKGTQTPTLSFVSTSNIAASSVQPTSALAVSIPILPAVQTTKIDSWAGVINN